MHPIVLFFEDHRDPIAKEILSQHLSNLQALQVNTVTLEIDKDTTIEKHLDDLLSFCKLWSSISALSSVEKEKILHSVSPERKVEFQHQISNLPARKAEAKLVLNIKHMAHLIKFQGFDLNLGEIRTLKPHQQMNAALTMQIEREQVMVNNLTELSVQGGVAAILGLSHYEVAIRLKQQGHKVFCFLPVSILHDEGVCSEFLKKIEQNDETVKDLIVLDRRVHSMDEIWQRIESTIQPRHSSEFRQTLGVHSWINQKSPSPGANLALPTEESTFKPSV